MPRQADPRIGPTVAESTPWWDASAARSATAPNIVVVVLDDTGWSDFGCFGSEIHTPTIDALAAAGTRFNNFHVTPLCSPTRASLLTGKNHHSVGMRFLAVTDSGFPNARGKLPDHVPTVPALLCERGYGTYLVGKWHLAPQEELTPAGPFKNWPLARGFERFYGFLGGASDQHLPELYRDNSPVELADDPDYHLSSDLVDRSIDYLTDHVGYRPDDPFFLQLAFGATHAPFQAPAENIDRYRGRYAAGWDELRQERFDRQRQLGVVPQDAQITERDSAVPIWDSLSDEERRLAARGQEAFAGFLEHTDEQLARLVAWLADAGQLENTLIAVMSDNGAAGDGRELGTTNVIAPYNNEVLSAQAEAEGLAEIGDRNHPAHYATGWAMVGNTPFRQYKQYVDLGGTRSPLVLHWPGVAAPGQIRSQFAHVVDLAATFADVAIPADDAARDSVLAQLDGASLRAVITDAAAPATRDTQYFEMLGHRAIWHDGWRAVTRHEQGAQYSDDTWRLYDVGSDFSESTDLASAHPDRLNEMTELWWSEAERCGVLPLDDRSLKDLLVSRALGTRPLQTTLVLRPGQSHLGFTTRLTGTNRTMRVSARLNRLHGEVGVLLASGAEYGGYILYISEDGKLHFEHRFLGEHASIHSSVLVPERLSTVGFHLRRGRGRSAEVALLVDDAVVGAVHVPTTSVQPAFYGLDIGRDRTARSLDHHLPNANRPFPAAALADITLFFDEEAENYTQLSHHLEVNQ